MSPPNPQELLAVIRRGYEIWNNGRLDLLEELLSPDFRAHDPTAPGGLVSRGAIREVLEQIRVTFPDIRREVCDYVTQGDKIAVRWRTIGTHRGPFAGMAPTGRQVVVTGITFYRIAGGRIAEEWVEMDSAGLSRQLAGG
jgi:steroid delta-isomerase-like uncharacterized protein